MNRYQFIILLCLIAAAVVAAALLVLPPRDFPIGRVVEIPAGASVEKIASILQMARVISSAKIFSGLVVRQGLEPRLQAGNYEFEKPLWVGDVVERLSDGIFSTALVRLTVPEGLSLAETAKAVHAAFPDVSESAFIAAAAPEQGFLFPDTYRLPPHATVGQVTTAMRENFDHRTEKLKTEIASSTHPLAEIVNLAALVENEAREPADRRLIADILWRRLAKGQKLEVDVAPATYRAVGLPAAPISNPGLDAIEAALKPTPNQFWFYLSDKNGIMHYAKTFAEHQKNVDKYLKK